MICIQDSTYIQELTLNFNLSNSLYPISCLLVDFHELSKKSEVGQQACKIHQSQSSIYPVAR